jgi:hypothetical protein
LVTGGVKDFALELPLANLGTVVNPVHQVLLLPDIATFQAGGETDKGKIWNPKNHFSNNYQRQHWNSPGND